MTCARCGLDGSIAIGRGKYLCTPCIKTLEYLYFINGKCISEKGPRL